MSNGHLDEITGSITGVTIWVITHIWSFHTLQIQGYPVASELIISSIRLVFGVATAVIAYIFIHWIKVNITHEIKNKK